MKFWKEKAEIEVRPTKTALVSADNSQGVAVTLIPTKDDLEDLRQHSERGQTSVTVSRRAFKLVRTSTVPPCEGQRR